MTVLAQIEKGCNMPTPLSTIWEVMRNHFPQNKQINPHDIYKIVQEHINLAPDDFLPEATMLP